MEEYLHVKYLRIKNISDDIHGPIFLYWKTEVSTRDGGISKMFVLNVSDDLHGSF